MRHTLTWGHRIPTHDNFARCNPVPENYAGGPLALPFRDLPLRWRRAADAAVKRIAADKGWPIDWGTLVATIEWRGRDGDVFVLVKVEAEEAT